MLVQVCAFASWAMPVRAVVPDSAVVPVNGDYNKVPVRAVVPDLPMGGYR